MSGTTSAPASPFDPFLHRFLQEIRASSTGFLPGPQTREIAMAIDLPDAMIEALFISARSRKLIRPDYANRRGRRNPWIVSEQGRLFLANATPSGDNRRDV
jgi:hypothetical protein